MNKEKINEDIVKERKLQREKDERIRIQKQKEQKELQKEAIKKKKILRKQIEKRNRKKFWVRYEDEISIAVFVLLVLVMLYFKFFVSDDVDLSKIKINDEEYIKSRSDEIKDFFIGESSYFSDKTMENANKMANNYLNNLN